MRKIIHVDMDAFYASVEVRDDPSLRGKPVVVGGSPSGRGVVAAASYEARKFGIHSAMPSREALRRCKTIVFIKPRFDVYREVSGQIREIFHRYAELVEPLSLDEAYLDVTENLIGLKSATLIAERIRRDIFRETALTASAGVSINKFLAKVASGIQKPDGLTVIPPSKVDAFLDQLAIDRFFGIGPASAKRLHESGIHTGADLREWSETDLSMRFGKQGERLSRIICGTYDSPVRPNRIRKSIGVERTFSNDLLTLEAQFERLDHIASELFRRIEKADVAPRTLTIKIRSSRFETISRQHTFPDPLASKSDILDAGKRLLTTPAAPFEAVRLLGLTVSQFQTPSPAIGRQLELPFPNYKDSVRSRQSAG